MPDDSSTSNTCPINLPRHYSDDRSVPPQDRASIGQDVAEELVSSDGSVVDDDASNHSRIDVALPVPAMAVPASATMNCIMEASEVSPLLGGSTSPSCDKADDTEVLERSWIEAVKAGRTKTTWLRELKVIAKFTAPLIATSLLGYSLVLSSMLAIGHLGTVELGAISVGGMSANITGYAFFQGLATAGDTLCAQAYGSGRKKLVGLQMQRMVYFLWLCCVPIGALWLCSPYILRAIVPEPDVAQLAGRYLRIVLIGLPPFAAFEGGKRYLYAQGIFSASLYVLMVVAPINAFLNWFFVWHLGWGFIGAPITTIISNYLLAIGLITYICFVNGSGCWPGFTRRALHNWGPMVRLAVPGLLMVEAEVLSFEILTLASSYFGTVALAANSVLAQASSLTWQLPFPLSIATSTRIANLIGATLPDAAKTTARVGLCLAFCIGLFNFALLSAAKDYIPRAFSSDPEVWHRAAAVLPLCAAFQLFDALAASCNGILRGLGRQDIGGYVQLFCYYVVAIPISLGTAFGAGWGLEGLWTGIAIALCL